MKISLTTVGCKLNQAEINDLKGKLQQAGYIIVAKNSPHDLHIINACSITHGAEKITRQKIREAKRANPQLQIFAMGCLNQAIPEINRVFKNSNEVLNFIEATFPASQILRAPQDDSSAGSKTRGLIKIQSGCNFNCTYCIIHKFRGKSESIPFNQIISQIQKLERQGYKEIILVGQNILQYNYRGKKLTELVKEVLKQTTIPRIRFSSLDPRLITGEFLKLLKNPRVCPHLHLSLQSGSDKILKLMNRNYTVAQYLKIVKQAQKINPLTSITTDIIIGFPGETDKDFQDTLNFVKKIDWLKIHIFPYSAREGTKAADFKNQIEAKIKKERFTQLSALAKKQKAKFLKKMKGKKLPVLFEHKRHDYYQGFTSNYIQVRKKSNKNLQNKTLFYNF